MNSITSRPGPERMPLAPFREAAIELLSSQIDLLSKKELDALLAIPPMENGDLAFPCFALARHLRKAPALIARELKESIGKTGAKALALFTRLELAGPYLNFFFNYQELVGLLTTAASELGENYGELEETGQKIIVEHTSANPNGPFHVGRARNPIIGDTMVRILRNCGHEVSAEYYVNDMGKQAMLLKWGVENLDIDRAQDYLDQLRADQAARDEQGSPSLEQLPKKPDYPHGVLYRKAVESMEKDPGVKTEIEADMLALEKGNRELGRSARENCDRVLEGLLMSLEKLNIHIDTFSYESDYVFDGSVEEVIGTLKKSERLIEEDGAYGLDLAGIVHGRSTKFFFTRAGGTSLYTTRDLAYHRDKLGRCDVAINVLGEDHKLQSTMLRTALEEIALAKGEETKFPEVMFYSFVTLKEGKMSARKGRKMSTRKGRVVYFDDLIAEGVHLAQEDIRSRRPDLSEQEARELGALIGKGAVRFNIIKVQPEKYIQFSWTDALNFEGESAPFVMYSAVRCASILEKAGFEGSLGWDAPFDHEMEHKLIRQLASFPGTVAEAGEKRAPHLIAAYALKTASIFNMFYRDCKVIGSGEAKKGRLSLVTITRQVLVSAMGLLGIEVPEKM